MKKNRVAKSVLAAGLAVVCVAGIAGCSSSSSGSSSNSSGGVAAEVNGTEIAEETITTYIESFRSTYGLEDDESWAEWMISYEYTVESVREEVVESYIQRELILAEAEVRGLEVDTTEIDEYIDYMIELMGSEEQWEEALEDAGMTEDQYREELEVQMIDAALQESFEVDEVSEDDMLTYGLMYATSYDGAKKSSHILFSSDDEETAQEVLDMINNGEIDFEEAAALYSTDSSYEDGGNVGWDCLTTFVDEYQDALDELEEGEVSGLVESDYGIHIIMCTEVYTAPTTTDEDGEETVEITSIDQIPEEWQEAIEESLIALAQEEAYEAWLEEAYEAADITIYDVDLEELSYYVDLSEYEDDDDEDSDDSDDSDSDSDDSDESDDSDDSTDDSDSDSEDTTDDSDSDDEQVSEEATEEEEE